MLYAKAIRAEAEIQHNLLGAWHETIVLTCTSLDQMAWSHRIVHSK